VVYSEHPAYKINGMNTMYLDLNASIQRIGDKELVDEMLALLHQSLETDWQIFEGLMTARRFAEAEKVLHQLKGVIPLFSDENTASVLNHLDALLKDTSDAIGIQDEFVILQLRMQGFQTELDDWMLKDI
jgi:hypothetical protein